MELINSVVNYQKAPKEKKKINFKNIPIIDIDKLRNNDKIKIKYHKNQLQEYYVQQIERTFSIDGEEELTIILRSNKYPYCISSYYPDYTDYITTSDLKATL